MKKIILTFILLLLISTTIANDSWQQTTIETVDLNALNLINNQSVSIWFCDNDGNIWSSLKLGMQPWISKSICVIIKNNTNSIQSIKLNIVDAYPWGKTYKLDDDENIIQQYLTNNIADTYFIPANSEIKKETEITFPFWIKGNQSAGLVYQWTSINDNKKTFWIISRKVLRMDFFVLDTDLTNWNNISATNIETFKSTEGKLHTKGNIENNWVLNETIDIHWTISNIFWFHKEFEIKNIKVAVWQSAEFNTENIEINSFLPTYGWLFNIKLDINYKPYFDFDVSNLDIDEEIKKWWTISINKTFFQAPRLALWWLILIIFLLILAFRKPKQKVVYVQQPQQPTPNV